MLNTTQMNTVLNVLTKFIQSKDTFTIDNIIKIIKDGGDQFNGFWDSEIDEDYYIVIEKIVDHIISTYYKGINITYKKVYTFTEAGSEEEDQEFDQVEELKDEVSTPKSEEKEQYVRPQIFNNMNDTMEEEWSDPDEDSHRMAYGKNCEEIVVDKQKRITISKDIVKEAEFEEGDELTILQHKSSNESFILLPTVFVEECVDEREFNIIKRKVVVKNGVIRIGIGSIIKGVEAGFGVMVKVNEDYNTKLKHILIYI